MEVDKQAEVVEVCDKEEVEVMSKPPGPNKTLGCFLKCTCGQAVGVICIKEWQGMSRKVSRRNPRDDSGIRKAKAATLFPSR